MKSFFQGIFGEFYGNIIWTLIDATQWTIYLSLTAFIGGGIIGFLLTMGRVIPNTVVNRLCAVYVWLFQSIPLLMLLFLTGLGIPVFFKIDVPAWVAATVSLTLFTSAYLAEVWRGSVEAIPEGQWESGRALGLNFWNCLRLVVAPQALRIATPPTVGFMVQIIKGTSLVYIIDYNDVMRWGKKIANAQLEGAEPFVIFPMVALIYFSLCFPLSYYSRRLEKKLLLQRGIEPVSYVTQGA